MLLEAAAYQFLGPDQSCGCGSAFPEDFGQAGVRLVVWVAPLRESSHSPAR